MSLHSAYRQIDCHVKLSTVIRTATEEFIEAREISVRTQIKRLMRYLTEVSLRATRKWRVKMFQANF
jgi:hypothetical protein